MAVTLHELARAANVSVATVSRALTNSAHPVNEATRQRILALANELGYRPNLVARGLRTDRTGMVGIIIDTIVSPFSPLIVRGIQDYLAQRGYYGVIINSDWDPKAEVEAIHNLIARSIDGIVFVESWQRGANTTLDLANKPYVFVHRRSSPSEHNSVSVDERYGAGLAVEHLATLGHRRIGFVGGPPAWTASIDRLLGYQETLERRQLHFDPALVHEGTWELESGFQAGRKLLALSERPSAIFAVNDLMALGVIYAAQAAGLRVPEDLAVVGYDDREIASLSRPTITTVTLPCYAIGQALARMLLELLTQQQERAEPVKVRGHLVVRESSGDPEGRLPLDQYRSHLTHPPQFSPDDAPVKRPKGRSARRKA